jgi:predicted DNA-binding antitoxin AbrB/MazE fold protein
LVVRRNVVLVGERSSVELKEGKTMRVQISIAGAIAAAFFCAANVARLSAQDAPSARSEQTEAQLAAGTAIVAELNSGLDSKKLKAGDAVTAHTIEPMKSTDGRTIMPRGTKLDGRVTQAEARNKGGSASTLGIQFDKAVLKDGTEIALNVVIQAIAPREFSGPAGGGDDSSPRAIGTTQTSPMAGSHAPAPNSSPQTADMGGGPGNFPGGGGARLDERSRGAVGMKGITLDAQEANGRAATLISSNGKSVKLDEGTRVLLVVQEKKGEAAPQ